MTTFRLSDNVAPAFRSVHCAIKSGSCGEALLAGGRGSGKSSYVSMELILQLLRHPESHAVVLRKRENRLRTSVYAQLNWAIREMGLTGIFKSTLSPLELVYQPTGQKILFLGMDDPEKIKSLKAPFGHFGLLWFEEYDQFGGPEEIRSIEQSVLRGGEFSLVFKTFNPPRSSAHWVNRDFSTDKPGRVCSRSSYLDMPKQWLGSRFLMDAQQLKNSDLAAYEHEYLGKANGTGGQVFRNLTLRSISPKERADLSDRLYHGIDWGWLPDPFVYVSAAYLPNERRIFLLDEFSGNCLSNEDIAAALRSHGLTGEQRILCDSGGEGQKSASDLRGKGFSVRCARKGPGSVERSMKWLLSQREIVIDPKSCPLAAEEFSRYAYEQSRDGAIINGFPDRDNHSIDALRYALEVFWSHRWSG